MPKDSTPPANDQPAFEDPVAVDLRLFAAVAMFCAIDDIRWYLAGVHVMPNPAGAGAFIVATNGHQLAIAHDPDGRCVAATILACNAEFAKVLRKRGSFKPGHVVLRGDRVIALNGDGSELRVIPGAGVVQGKYPDVMRLLRPLLDATLEEGMRGHFNATYIKQLGRAATFLGDGAGHMQHWTHPSGILYTRLSGALSMLVVTMSMRGGDALKDAAPAGIKAAIEHEAAAALAAEAETKARAAAAKTVVNADA